MNYYLCIDYGGTNTKIIVYSEKGEECSISSFSTLKIEAIPGFREIDLIKAWQTISEHIKKTLLKAGLTGDAIQAVICVGHGKGLYLLDKNHHELMNGILSVDIRGASLAADFEKRVAAIWPISYQHVVASQSPVLLKWLKVNQPERYREIGAILSAKDYLRFKLTDTINQELGDASGNNLIDIYSKTYSDELLAFFEIEEMRDCLPPLISFDQIAGRVTEKASQETGLRAGTVVIGGMFDIDACAIGTGVLDDTMLSVIAGTWNINTYPTAVPASIESGEMTSLFPNDKYLIEASSPTSAGNLEIMLKMLMNDELSSVKNSVNGSIYDVLEEFLAETDATFSKVLFLPFLYGSNVSPFARSSFIGLTSTTTRSELLRAVYEGVVFAHKQHIEGLLREKERQPVVIRLSGGATNSDQWCQIFADILEMPVETVTVSEVGGLGGAIVCHQVLNQTTLSESVDQMVSLKQRFEPNQQETRRYLKKYELYQSVIQKLDPFWQEMAKVNDWLASGSDHNE